MADAITLLHLSDVHCTSTPHPLRPSEWWGKRLCGYAAGVLSGRRRSLARPEVALDRLADDAAPRTTGALLFSGDATSLALPDEFHRAAELLGGVRDKLGVPGVAVPGNHDRYTPRATSAKLFEAAFGDWQPGERIGGSAYPFAVKLGPAWVVALDSARPNRGLGDASGAVGPEQLARFRELCAALSPGPRLVLTHYPLWTSAGEPEHTLRRLVDHAECLDAATDCGVRAWLCGHIHTGFVRAPKAGFPVQLCAGSATQEGRRMYSTYAVTAGGLTGTRRQLDGRTGEYVTLETFELGWG